MFVPARPDILLLSDLEQFFYVCKPKIMALWLYLFQTILIFVLTKLNYINETIDCYC